MEENCVELILFGDSGHFVLTSILQIIALCWLLNFKYAAKYQVKSLKYGPTGNFKKHLKWAILNFKYSESQSSAILKFKYRTRCFT